jgi:hypothetical protein
LSHLLIYLNLFNWFLYSIHKSCLLINGN